MTYSKFTFLIFFSCLLFSCKSNSKEPKTTSVPEQKEATNINDSETDTNANEYTTHNVSWSEIESFEKVPFDFLVYYGEDSLHFGELRTPLSQKDTFPLVIYIHGGCWLDAYNLDYVSTVADDLVKDGYAVWVPEYRRVGNAGGGYPNTFKDIQASVDFARTLAEIYPLDLDRVVIMGHSAGGHLALWSAAQSNLPKNSRLYNPNPLSVKGIIALAGITDLTAYDKIGNSCSTAVPKLMGGDSDKMNARYFKSSPINLLPTGIPIRMIHGQLDNIVPLSQSEAFVEKAKAAGDDVTMLMIEGGGHFDMASPYSEAWKVVKQELKKLLE